MTEDQELTTAERLNLETAQVAWSELERHFARGVLLVVAPGVDLIQAATALVEDDAAAVARWRDQRELRAATDDDARRMHESEAPIWAVVVAPFVLAQSCGQP